MPSIHSTVSTRRAVRFQSTSGTRKPSSPAVFSAISEMAAASRRRSISSSVVRLERVDDGDGLQAPRRRMQALDQARGEVVAVEVAAELLLDAGAQDLDGDLAPAPVGVDDGRLVHLRDRGGGDGGAELGKMILQLAAERFLDGAARLGHGERRQVVLQQRQIAGELRADDVGARRQELAELDVAGAETGEGGGEARAAWLAGAERCRQQGDRRRRRFGPGAAAAAPACRVARNGRRAAPARGRLWPAAGSW